MRHGLYDARPRLRPFFHGRRKRVARPAIRGPNINRGIDDRARWHGRTNARWFAGSLARSADSASEWARGNATHSSGTYSSGSGAEKYDRAILGANIRLGTRIGIIVMETLYTIIQRDIESCRTDHFHNHISIRYAYREIQHRPCKIAVITNVYFYEKENQYEAT